MSHWVNDQWVEAAWEGFEIAVVDGRYELAQDIISDCIDYGFENEATSMLRVLLEKPVNSFITKSPYYE